MRVKRARLSDGVRDYRITPAHAGKTGLEPYEMHISEDHPRACG